MEKNNQIIMASTANEKEADISSDAMRRSSVAFDVEFEPVNSFRHRPPERLASARSERKLITQAGLEHKLNQAEVRRKAYEAARMDRIHEVDKEVCKITATVDVIMHNDALRRRARQAKDVDNTQLMTPKQTRESVRAVQDGFNKLHKISNLKDLESIS